MFLKNISKFISGYKYNQATIETINVAKAAFLDYLGVTYRGFKEKPSQIAFNTTNEIFKGNSDYSLKASVIGKRNYKTDVLSAGFINGISAHSLELDDGHRLAHVHLGAIAFSTALPLAEALDVNGINFLESIIVGYETGIMLGQIVNPEHRNSGFHSSGTIGTFVAGSVASKLLKLSTNEIINVLGLCGTQASGLLVSDHSGSMGKTLHIGKAVHSGIMSTFLAKNGFTGSENIMEGEEGFLSSMVFANNSLTKNKHNLDQALRNIGEIKFKDIYFKKYPFCRHLHSAIDTALKLRNTINGQIKHIAGLAVKTYDIAAEHNNYNPTTLEELKQSLPYAIAIALVCGDVNVDNINKLIDYGLLKEHSEVNKVNLIKQLANKIIIVKDEELNSTYPEKRPSILIIKLDDHFRNGVFQNMTEIPKGDVENPFELRELIDKFKELNPDYDIGKLVLIDNIEDYNMGYVVNLLNRE